MRVRSYVYDSAERGSHVDAVLERVERREESVDCLDVAAAEDRAGARREAMLTVKSAVRIGSPPAALFDEDGRPDFSAGALITEEATGRRSLHVGTAALEALDGEG
jgi:hypothetical protein